MIQRHATLACAALLLSATEAAAQDFAPPPDGEQAVAVDPDADPRFDHRERHFDDRYDDFSHPRSSVRLSLGPALRIGDERVDGGLFAAIDAGEGPAGARFSGAWVQVGSDGGLAQYSGELWLDFGHEKRLHPILGAGAGVARVETRAGARTRADVIGLGLLRGGLQYLLPVDGTDARASLEVIGTLPAIRGEDAPRLDPWMLVLATVGAGF